MGGAREVLKRARADYAEGNYRWVAQVLDHVVSADPSDREARELEADALEQLGYQAESGPWRNFYLSAAQELRGVEPRPAFEPRKPGKGGQLAMLPPEDFFRALAVRLDGLRAGGRQIRFAVEFTDGVGRGKSWTVDVRNGVLHAHEEKETEKNATRLVGPKARVFATLMGSQPLPGAEQNSGVRLVGDAGEVASFLELLERAPDRYSLTMPHEAE